MSTFQEIFKCSSPLLIDGGMGSNLMHRGLAAGQAPEELLRAAPEVILGLHRDFVEAGSGLILTNSFGGNARRLELHGLADDVAAVNELAARLARQAAEAAGAPRTLIAGSMGPTGDLLAPLGTLTHGQAAAVYADQARGLAAGGADVLWLETLAAKDEVMAAVEGASVAGLPIALTLSFDASGKTMMGLSPADFAALADTLPLVAYGANCGAGLSDLALVMAEMAGARRTSKTLIAKGNCGIPKFVEGEVRYSGTPALMATYAQMMAGLGVGLIGGCCGTTPGHIAAMAAALAQPQDQIAGKTAGQAAGDTTLSRDQILTALGETSVPTQAPKARTRKRARG